MYRSHHRFPVYSWQTQPDSTCVACSELHENFPVVPEPIRLYIEEVKLVLQAITEAQAPGHGLHEKLNFLRETRHAFGRTALVLSGGGALGAFHVVSFTSQGQLCTQLTDHAVGRALLHCSGCTGPMAVMVSAGRRQGPT